MTTKTPSGLADGGSGSDDETIDDSLDEILLRANEKPLESQRPTVPRLQLPQRTSAPTLLAASTFQDLASLPSFSLVEALARVLA